MNPQNFTLLALEIVGQGICDWVESYYIPLVEGAD